MAGSHDALNVLAPMLRDGREGEPSTAMERGLKWMLRGATHAARMETPHALVRDYQRLGVIKEPNGWMRVKQAARGAGEIEASSE